MCNLNQISSKFMYLNTKSLKTLKHPPWIWFPIWYPQIGNVLLSAVTPKQLQQTFFENSWSLVLLNCSIVLKYVSWQWSCTLTLQSGVHLGFLGFCLVKTSFLLSKKMKYFFFLFVLFISMSMIRKLIDTSTYWCVKAL